jgi:hypothetical protein
MTSTFSCALVSKVAGSRLHPDIGYMVHGVPMLLTDDDVRLLPPEVAVDAARAALVDAYRGSLIGGPRVRARAGDEELVFTVGGYRRGLGRPDSAYTASVTIPSNRPRLFGTSRGSPPS